MESLALGLEEVERIYVAAGMYLDDNQMMKLIDKQLLDDVSSRWYIPMNPLRFLPNMMIKGRGEDGEREIAVVRRSKQGLIKGVLQEQHS